MQGSEEQINAGLKSLETNGFINYFGLQRFGTNIAVPTHVVGKALLLGDWQRVRNRHVILPQLFNFLFSWQLAQ